VPSHKSVVLGLISTKVAALEDKDSLKRRLDEAVRFIDIERLAVSPQCGFASVDTGNPISPQLQEQKLRLVVELAHDIWGSA
jgi:5-methyltetrahydropteroyltriglutamate--homocysteine methyltransferase